MKDLIVIAGAPGSGKTVVSDLLRKELGFPPMIDLGNIRNLHLDRQWSNTSKKEEKMSYENFVYIVKNYRKYRYRNVIATDFEDYMLQQIPKSFPKMDYVIITLVIEGDKELEKRVLDTNRDSGFRNVQKAVEWNRQLKQRKLLRNEYRIDNSHNKPEETVKKILEIVQK